MGFKLGISQSLIYPHKPLEHVLIGIEVPDKYITQSVT